MRVSWSSTCSPQRPREGTCLDRREEMDRRSTSDMLRVRGLLGASLAASSWVKSGMTHLSSSVNFGMKGDHQEFSPMKVSPRGS